MAVNYTDSDKAKFMTGQYLKEIKLYFPYKSLTILNDEIYAESLSLEESIFDGNGELSIVGCISNRFSIEIRNQGVQLKNESIQVSIRIDGGNWYRLFTGYVDSVETVRDRSYQKLQCYDVLYKYQDKNFFDTYDHLNFPTTIYNLRNALCNFMGISQQQTTLVNDNYQIPKMIDGGEIAVIDALRAICQINGVFGKVDNLGVLHYVDLSIPSGYLPYPSDDLFPASELYPSNSEQETIYIDSYQKVAFEDYDVAEITEVTVREGANDTEYGHAGTIGNALLIEGNMWTQGLTETVKDDIAQNLLDKVQYTVYQPFEATSIGLPFIECGDAIAYYVYDYSSGSPVTHVMGFSVMTRYLKGIQWMTDTFSANGLEYQPEVKPVQNDKTSQEITNIENNLSNVQTSVTNLESDKQDKLTAGTGISINSNTISVTNPIYISQTNLTPGSSSLATNAVYLVYE